MVGLGFMLENYGTIANGISSDGTVIVGSGGAEAFRWTQDEGMVGLGDLPGGNFYSTAEDVSTGGKIIVGIGKTDDGDTAFIWDPVFGIRNIKEILENSYGLDLTGWTLQEAVGVSDDGRVLVGEGRNPNGDGESWIAWIPIWDEDDDDMYDAWEEQHFGNKEACDPSGDPDNDNFTNLDEYNNDTDPHNFDVGPIIQWPAFELGWRTVAGTNYQLQCSSALNSNVWNDVGSPILGVDGTNTVLISTRDADAKFHRVIVVP